MTMNSYPNTSGAAETVEPVTERASVHSVTGRGLAAIS
jgi:hypothetical protein